MRSHPTSVLVVAPDLLGPAASGPARRAAKLAAAVGPHCAVTLAAPESSTFPVGPFRTASTGVDGDLLPALVRATDVAVVQALASPRQLLLAVRDARHLIVDLIAPLAFEMHAAGRTQAQRRAQTGWRVRQLVDHLHAADLVLCTNERQRDLYVGSAMASTGAVPDMDRFVVVPHGIDAPAPSPGGRPLRDTGLVGATDRVAVWAGGLWDWLDPITPIQAVELLRERRPDLRLVFVGTGRADGPGKRTRDRAVAYARDRGLEGDSVLFVPGWLDRSEYVDYLLEAEIGVSAHQETAEARYATRTRVLDYLWAGLRVVCTAGETVGDFAEAAGLGATAPPGDADAFARALDAQLGAKRRAPADRAALEPLLWENAARPLIEYCRNPVARRPEPRARVAAHAVAQYPSFLRAIYREAGLRGLSGAASRRLRRG